MTDHGVFRCPLCGHRDAVEQTYNARKRELKVSHIDGSRCEQSPVDEWGRAVS